MKRRSEVRTPTPAHPLKYEKQLPDFEGSDIEAVENVDTTNFTNKPPIKNLKRSIVTPPGVKYEVSAEKVVQANYAPQLESSYIGKIRLVGNFKVSPNSAFDPFIPDQATVKNSTTLSGGQ